MGEVIVRVIDAYIYHYNEDKLRFLILKRSKKKIYEYLWQGVAGKIEKGENASQTAIRELKEENLIEEETSLTEFSEKCFKLGLNEYLKKLYYYSTDFR